MTTEHLHLHVSFVCVIRDTGDILACVLSDVAQVLISFVIDERTVGFETVHELTEGVHVLREGREDVDVIPCDTGQNSYVRVVPEELRPQVER